MSYSEIPLKGQSVSIFKSKTEKKSDPIDEVIANLANEMVGHEGHTEEYANCAAALKTLYEAKATLPKRNVLSADTAATIAANLVGIIMIIGHERANVITTKALGFIIKPRT